MSSSLRRFTPRAVVAVAALAAACAASPGQAQTGGEPAPTATPAPAATATPAAPAAPAPAAAPPAAAATPQTPAASTPARPAAAAEAAPGEAASAEAAPERVAAPEAAPAAGPAPTGAAAAAAAAPPTTAADAAQELTVERVKRAWELILQRVQAARVPLYGFLRDGRPTALENDVLTVSLPSEFAARNAAQGDNAQVLAAAVEGVLGRRLTVRIDVAAGAAPSPETPAAAGPRTPAALPDFTDQIRAAQAKLDAELLPDEP